MGELVNINCCETNENVCYGGEVFHEDFFYFYISLFNDFYVKLLFDHITIKVF